MRTFTVYILCNRNRRLYVGVTSNLSRRLHEHRAGTGGRFTSKYGISRLVLVECYRAALDAITREKRIKGWRRAKKVALIEAANPDWEDLGSYVVG
jgi:putative endonuclease